MLLIEKFYKTFLFGLLRRPYFHATLAWHVIEKLYKMFLFGLLDKNECFFVGSQSSRAT